MIGIPISLPPSRLPVWRLLPLLFLAVLHAASSQTPVADESHVQPHAGAARVRALLDDAAARFDIPSAVLYGVAYTESRWHDVVAPGAHSCMGMPPAIGIMGLHDDDYFGHSLAAAAPIGISAEDARNDMVMNIRAGAYLLSTLFSGTDRKSIAEWIPAIAAYSGIPAGQPALRLLYADGVMEALRRGWTAGDQIVAPVDAPYMNRSAMLGGMQADGILPSTDYPGAQWQPSPNYSSREGTPVTAITIHDTEGNFAGSLSWLTSTESQASAHYMIRSIDGFVVQMVRESDKAWHVRSENPYTIGIEHEGYVDRPEFFTPAMYNASADLVRYLTAKYSIALNRTLVKGHLDFPNNTHTDPGGWWDWPGYYRAILRDPAAPVVVDMLEDNVVGWWNPAMSGSTTGADTAASTFSITANARATGLAGAEISYRFTGATGGIVRCFRSGHGNTSDGLLNVGTANDISLLLRGDGSGNMLELWYYDANRNNVVMSVGTLERTDWHRVSLPLSLLGDSARGPWRFHSLVIRQSPGAARSGTAAIDDIGVQRHAADVEEHRAAPDNRPVKLAMHAYDPFPAAMQGETPCTIVDIDGRTVGEFRELPGGAAGDCLRPGVYALHGPHGATLLLVTP
ncbi:MAG TPA: N-acetylmuramoyl-L-alanine amidase [Candidatus Kapabacteria bacterium]|nr:N-acetylmuramoyl-L-alanine amidase [Candidatus Kapabacteria bacterium]